MQETIADAWNRAEDSTYRLMQNQYATQEATRKAEADAVTRMRQMERIRQQQQAQRAGLDMGRDYTGFLPGTVQVKAATPAQAPAQAPATFGAQTPTQAPVAPAVAPQKQDVSIGSLVQQKGSKDYYPGDTALDYSAALTPIVPGKPRYTGRQQYYPMSAEDMKTYNSNIAFIPKYQKSKLASTINQYAKQAGIDPNIIHAIALQETSGGTRIKDSPQGASGALQITEGAYKDVLSRIPQFTKDPNILSMVASLPSNWSQATPDDKIKGGVLYAKLLSMIGQKGNKGQAVSPSRVLASYFGGESRLKGALPSVKDSLGRMLPDYVAMTTGYYNAMSPMSQSDMLEIAGSQPTQVAQTPQGAPAQQTPGGLSPSGEYTAPAVQVPQVAQGQIPTQAAQEAGLTTLIAPAVATLPAPIQKLANLQQVLSSRADAMLQTGAFDKYQELATQELAVTTQLYDQLAELGAAELTQYGAPRRLMSLLSSFSGTNAQVQLRSDGKLDLYMDGNKVSGDNGVTAQRLSTMVKNMVSAQARAQHTAAATEAMKLQGNLENTRLKGQFDIAGRAVTGQYNALAAKLHGGAGGTGVKTVGTLADGSLVTYDPERGYSYITPGGTQEINGEEVETGPTIKPVAGIVPFTNVLQ